MTDNSGWWRGSGTVDTGKSESRGGLPSTSPQGGHYLGIQPSLSPQKSAPRGGLHSPSQKGHYRSGLPSLSPPQKVCGQVDKALSPSPPQGGRLRTAGLASSLLHKRNCPTRFSSPTHGPKTTNVTKPPTTRELNPVESVVKTNTDVQKPPCGPELPPAKSRFGRDTAHAQKPQTQSPNSKSRFGGDARIGSLRFGGTTRFGGVSKPMQTMARFGGAARTGGGVSRFGGAARIGAGVSTQKPSTPFQKLPTQVQKPPYVYRTLDARPRFGGGGDARYCGGDVRCGGGGGGGDRGPAALFLHAHDGETETVFPEESEANLNEVKVHNATLVVRPVATYTEVHHEGEKNQFHPWNNDEGRHPTPLAYDFTKTFPSAHGVKRTTLPDFKHFRYGSTMYDPEVSVVEQALRVAGVREKLSKYPPDALADGVGLLQGILRTSLRLNGAFAKHKRRSVVRIDLDDGDDGDTALSSARGVCRDSCESDEGHINASATADSESADTPQQKSRRDSLRLFTDNPTWYLDECMVGPRFEYICSQPSDKGDDDIEQNGFLVQPYGGFRVILEAVITPEVSAGDSKPHTNDDAAHESSTPPPPPQPITVLLCTEVDASDMRDPTKWVELKTSGRISKRSTFNRTAWCQAVLAGCQRAITLFHEGDRIIDIEAFDVSTTEDTAYVQNPKRHFGYLYNALRNIKGLATEPGKKYTVASYGGAPAGSWRGAP